MGPHEATTKAVLTVVLMKDPEPPKHIRKLVYTEPYLCVFAVQMGTFDAADSGGLPGGHSSDRVPLSRLPVCGR